MEFAVKRFARNILLLHLLLLGVVLGLLLLASKAIRDGAREQAQRQAESRQRMLASQTSRGIEAFYQSIVSDMGLFPREDETEAEKAQLGTLLREMTREISFPLFTPPPPPPATKPIAGPTTRGSSRLPPPQQTFKQRTARGLLVGQMLGRQLDERVTHLFIVARPLEPLSSLKSPAKPPSKLAPLLLRDVVIEPKADHGPTPAMLIDRYRDWLLAVKDHSISRFELFDAGAGPKQGLNLVAMPIGNGSTVLVAAVPVSTITGQFLSAINSDPNTGVMLVNDSLVVMASSRPALVGASLAEGADADLTSTLNTFKANDFKGSQLIEHPLTVAGEQFEPALFTAEPIDVAGRKWFIVVASPLREVDAVVAQLFGRIFVWAVIVVVVITAILISTSVQMIRGRLRLEKVRNEALRKEIDRARQIQQAWLPRTAPACRSVDLAAVNFPANHISGDFYNWFELPDGRIAVAIGDVTGHGMSAAFLMATTQLLVRTTMQRGVTDPADCLAEVNRQLCTLVFNGQFVTLLVLVIDPDGGAVEAASAGHPAPLLADGGRYRSLPVESGLVLGVDQEVAYETRSLELPPNAAILLYTDGAPDVLAPNGKRLGTDGLLKLCPEKRDVTAGHAGKSLDARKTLDALVASVNHFRGSREFGDDLTLVAVRLVSQPVPADEPTLAAIA